MSPIVTVIIMQILANEPLIGTMTQELATTFIKMWTYSMADLSMHNASRSSFSLQFAFL